MPFCLVMVTDFVSMLHQVMNFKYECRKQGTCRHIEHPKKMSNLWPTIITVFSILCIMTIWNTLCSQIDLHAQGTSMPWGVLQLWCVLKWLVELTKDAWPCLQANRLSVAGHLPPAILESSDMCHLLRATQQCVATMDSLTPKSQHLVEPFSSKKRGPFGFFRGPELTLHTMLRKSKHIHSHCQAKSRYTTFPLKWMCF